MPQPIWVSLLAWLVLLLAVYVPLGQLGWESIWIDGGVDFSPLRELLLTPRQWTLLANSLQLAAGATVVALLIGLPYAYLCQKTGIWGRSFLRLAYLVPLLIPPYMQAIVWGRLLSDNGLLNTMLVGALDLSEPPLTAYSTPGAAFVLGLAYFPFVTLLTMSGIAGVDRRYEEAALLQQGRFRTMAQVILPMVTPHVLAGAVFVFVFSLVDFSVPDILRVRVYPIEIFIQFSALYDERAAVIQALPLLLVTLALIALQVRIMRGRTYVRLADSFREIKRSSLGRFQAPAVMFCIGVIGLSVVVPVGVLLYTAGAIETYEKALISSFDQIGFSFLVAVLAAGIMTGIAFVIAHSMLNASPRVRSALEYVTQLPFAVPSIILGIGLIKVWNTPLTGWFYGSSLIIICGYLAHFIPFTIRVVYSSLQQLNRRTEEAAWLVSENQFRITARIIWPQIRDGLLIGFVISFVLAIGEIGVTLLVIPPGLTTIPIKIYNFMHYGAESTVAALCLILLCLQLMFLLGLFGISRWLGNQSQ